MQHLRTTGCIAVAGLLAAAILTTVAPSSPSTSYLALQESNRTIVGKLELHVEEWPSVESSTGASKETLTEYLTQKYSNRSRASVERIVDASFTEASKHGLNPLLVLAVIEKESSLQADVSNKYGAKGLMQVVPRWHPEKMDAVTHPKGLYHPETNIRVGTTILAEYLEKYAGNVDRALKKYSGSATDYAQTVKRYKAELERVLSTGLRQGKKGTAESEAA